MALTQSDYAASAAEFVASGAFGSTEEVLAAAMDALRQQLAHEQARDAFVHRAIEEGEASGIFEGDAFAEIDEEMGWNR